MIEIAAAGHAGASAVEPIAVTVLPVEGSSGGELPVTFTLPFSKGGVREADLARLVLSAEGAVRPVQARSLVGWPDGSVRWALIDTSVNVAKAPVRMLATIGTEAPRPAEDAGGQVRVRERSIGYEVDTGVLRFRVPRNQPAFLDGLATGTRPASGPLTASAEMEGRPVRLRPPRRVTLVERGPLRVRFELEGAYDDHLDYLVRVEAYAGQAFVRLWHTFFNRSDRPALKMSRLALELPFATTDDAKYSAGVEGGGALGGVVGAEPVRLVQIDNLGYRAGGESRAGKLAGWVQVADAGARLGLGARWFWQEYPQAFELDRRGVRYDMWAGDQGPALVGMGAAKTHEIVLWGGAGAAARPPLRPPVAVVDPAWVAASGALPQAIAATGTGREFAAQIVQAAHRYGARNDAEPWDDRGEVLCTSDKPDRPRTGAYGMWNWGDWNFRGYHDDTKGCDAWGNLEYDTAQVLGLTFAASGDPAAHDLFVAAARHFMDVDTIHFVPVRGRAEWKGMNHPKNPLHFSFELGGVDLGHTWTEGLLTYFYLTGDERGLTAARGIADYLVRRSRSVHGGNPRQFGWPQIALLAVFDATGEARYRDAALVYARRGLARTGEKPAAHWKEGILADALAYTHAATGDEAILDWLKRYAAAVVREGKTDPRHYPAVAYVGAVTGDAALEAAALAAVRKIDLGNWGKPFSIGGRIGFRVLSLVAGNSRAATMRGDGNRRR